MKRVFISFCISMVSVLAFGVSAYAAEIDDLSDVKAYCKEYGISMSNDPEFITSVRQAMANKYEYELRSSSAKKGPFKTRRNIPSSVVADVIWTNNPLTPFNHVGVYTKKNQITEALGNGVCSRKTGKQNEYPFEIYKVVTKNNSNIRYSEKQRSKVASWALGQVGKKYDTQWWNNKLNTREGNAKFNCSELVWKSWKFTAGVDLDSNGGNGVYPNDIRSSKRTKFVTKG